MASISIENPLFQTYIVYATLLCLKVLAMALFTARQRLNKNVFANEEDAKLHQKATVKYDDVDVERVRRAHLNDLENIPIILILEFLYILTEPNVTVAALLFRVAAGFRFLHTYAYVIKPQQPARAIGYGIPFFMCCYMGFRILRFFASAL